jgi:hypothetical protein
MNRIICAARRYETGIVAIGVEDGDKFMSTQVVSFYGTKTVPPFERGFVDLHGTFQNQNHALKIAFVSGQITPARFELGTPLTTQSIY